MGRDAADSCSFPCWDGSFDVQPPPPPPPLVCPLAAPDGGAPCNVPSYEDCEYGDAGYFCNEHLSCSFGRWSVNESLKLYCAPPQECASIVDGGGCGGFQVCGDEDAGTVCVCSECGSGPPPPPEGDAAWPFGWWRCFTPNTGCALYRANSGTSCDLPDGSTCAFTEGSCCLGVVDQCRNGVWQASETTPCLSRREFKTDIAYVDDARRSVIANETLGTSRGDFREEARRDPYGRASSLLATIQEQHKQIEALEKQVAALGRPPQASP